MSSAAPNAAKANAPKPNATNTKSKTKVCCDCTKADGIWRCSCSKDSGVAPATVANTNEFSEMETELPMINSKLAQPQPQPQPPVPQPQPQPPVPGEEHVVQLGNEINEVVKRVEDLKAAAIDPIRAAAAKSTAAGDLLKKATELVDTLLALQIATSEAAELATATTSQKKAAAVANVMLAKANKAVADINVIKAETAEAKALADTAAKALAAAEIENKAITGGRRLRKTKRRKGRRSYRTRKHRPTKR